MPRLILLRHGESTWNAEGLYTGWYDAPLSDMGISQALEAGKVLLKHDISFTAVFTSFLKRAIKTLWLTMEACDRMFIPVHTSWRLNERCVDDLQFEFSFQPA